MIPRPHAAVLAMLGLVTSLAARAGPPPPPALTPAQEAELSARALVVVEAAGPHEATVAVIDVQAPPARTFAAALDLPARVGEVGILKEVELYLQTDTRLGARLHNGMLGWSRDLYVLYELSPAEHYATYGLDPARENPIPRSDGSYQVIPTATGSRLVYRVQADLGDAPAWLVDLLQSRSLRSQLEGIRARAEAG